MSHNVIKESAVDAEGNVYVLGQFNDKLIFDCGIDVFPDSTVIKEFLPAERGTSTGVLIAKFDPAGQLVWCKIIYSNGVAASEPGWINDAIGMKLVGDTSLVCMATAAMPTVEVPRTFSYFLDTMYYGSDDFVFSTDSTLPGRDVMAYLELDLDGNLKEKVFLQAVPIFADGTLQRITSMSLPQRYLGRYDADIYPCFRFTVDRSGNIICQTDDHLNGHNMRDSAYAGYRILVNGGERHFDIMINDSAVENMGFQKFSPRFGKLLCRQYLYAQDAKPCDTVVFHDELNIIIASEKDNSLYYIGNVTTLTDDMVRVKIEGLPNDSIQGVGFWRSHAFLVKYDSMLNPQWMFKPEFDFDSYVDFDSDRSPVVKLDAFGGVGLDENGDLYCLMQISAKYTKPVYKLDTFTLHHHGLMFARLDAETGRVVSLGRARGPMSYENNTMAWKMEPIKLVPRNNLMATQVIFTEQLYVQDTIYTVSDRRYENHQEWGLLVWDKEGHDLKFESFHSRFPAKNTPMGVVLHDSIAYIYGQLVTSALFGDIPKWPGPRAYLAKYVDTLFSKPYVFTDKRVDQSISWNQDLTFYTVESPIRLTATASSGRPVQYVCADTNIAKVNGDILSLESAGVTTVTAYQEGTLYGFFPAEPVEKVLSVYQTGVDEVGQIGVDLYPNPTSGTVKLSVKDEEITEVSLTTAIGQKRELILKDNSVSLEHLPSGVYYLQVVTDRNVYQCKVIKR